MNDSVFAEILATYDRDVAALDIEMAAALSGLSPERFAAIAALVRSHPVAVAASSDVNETPTAAKRPTSVAA